MGKERKGYAELFFRRELRAMMGEGYRQLSRLVLLVTAMLLALGFALGGLKSLRERMDDPFTNIVSIPIPFDSEEVLSWRDTFMQPIMQARFHLDTAEFSQISVDWFQNVRAWKSEYFWIRSLHPDSPLKERLLSDPDILVRINDKVGSQPNEACGVIITYDAVVKLGLDPETVEYVPYLMDNQQSYTLMLPVIAVVRRLPDKTDMAVFDNMAILRNDPLGTGWVTPFERNTHLMLLLPGDDEEAIKAKVESHPISRGNADLKTKLIQLDGRTSYIQVDLFLQETLDYHQRMAKRDIINSDLHSDGLPVLLTFPIYCDEVRPESGHKLRTDHLNMMFSRLDSIREFEQSLRFLTDNRLSVDLSRIESSRNFALVARLTGGLSLALFIFCLLGMVFFMTNMVSNHLYQHKQGLGTLAAFGMSQRSLSNIYTRVLIWYMVLASGTGLAIVLLIKLALNIWDQAHLLSIVDPYILAALLLSWSVVLWSAHQSINRYLRRTPGDLIFNR
jgi:hypothetical protein